MGVGFMHCCGFESSVDEESVSIAVTVCSSSPHRRFRGIVSDLPLIMRSAI
jgi:hypothetical protein